MTPPVFNRSFVLEGPVRTADGRGGYRQTWEPLGVLWADVQAGSGRDANGPETPVARVTYRMTLRAAAHGAPSRPKAGQRLREGNRIFAVQAVAEVGTHGQYLRCFTQEEEVT